jgi:hypothetical protein
MRSRKRFASGCALGYSRALKLTMPVEVPRPAHSPQTPSAHWGIRPVLPETQRLSHPRTPRARKADGWDLNLEGPEGPGRFLRPPDVRKRLQIGARGTAGRDRNRSGISSRNGRDRNCRLEFAAPRSRAQMDAFLGPKRPATPIWFIRKARICGPFVSSGGGIRTRDLRVMRSLEAVWWAQVERRQGR